MVTLTAPPGVPPEYGIWTVQPGHGQFGPGGPIAPPGNAMCGNTYQLAGTVPCAPYWSLTTTLRVYWPTGPGWNVPVTDRPLSPIPGGTGPALIVYTYAR